MTKDAPIYRMQNWYYIFLNCAAPRLRSCAGRNWVALGLTKNRKLSRETKKKYGHYWSRDDDTGSLSFIQQSLASLREVITNLRHLSIVRPGDHPVTYMFCIGDSKGKCLAVVFLISWKTSLLEREYNSMMVHYDALKATTQPKTKS